MNRRRLATLSIFMICLLGISLGLTAPIPSARAEGEVILFVRESASSEDTAGDGETGYSWENAFSNLQDALDEAEDLQKEDETLQVEIRVAAGTYYPDGIGRYRGFRLRNNVAILGGFPAEGGALEERDWQRHETILSGNIGDPDKSTDNSYHVILAEDVDETAVLDGVIVSGGHTSPGFTPKYPPSFNLWTSGGGIYCDSSSPIIRNVQIRDNFAWYGGGMYIYQGSPQLDNVTFTGNTAFTGGAMRNESCNLTATGVKFEYNAALSGSGGAMANYSSSVSVADAEFLSNTADSAFGGNGGAVYNFGGSVFNCTGASFQSNHAFYSGGAIYSQGGGISLRNISFVGNQAGYAADDPEGVELSSFHPTNGGAVFFAPADAAAYSQGEEEYYPGIIQDAFFIGNKAGQGGGAVYAAEVKIVNSVFSGNSAVYGGGLYLEKRGRVVNSTFVANDALGCGGGAFIDFFDEGPVQENPALANTILWGNTAPEMGMQVFADKPPRSIPRESSHSPSGKAS
jgi:predicted outer membrane repeat protein